MERYNYMRDVYWRYWINAREDKYPFSQYDRLLCDVVCKNVSEHGKLLDVGIGTGVPFGDYFQRRGYDIYGLDLSMCLLEKCLSLYPELKCQLANAEAIGCQDDTFDCTYCFHSTWYFQDLHKVLDEMIRVVRPGGLIMFDIQNKYNMVVNRDFRKRVFENHMILGKTVKTFKNLAKVVLRRGIPEWNFVVHYTPTDPIQVCKYLQNKQMRFKMMVSDLQDILMPCDVIGMLEEYPRIVYLTWK